MSNKKRFDPFSNAKLTLQKIKNWGKDGDKNWMEAGILTMKINLTAKSQSC